MTSRIGACCPRCKNGLARRCSRSDELGGPTRDLGFRRSRGSAVLPSERCVRDIKTGSQ